MERVSLEKPEPSLEELARRSGLTVEPDALAGFGGYTPEKEEEVNEPAILPPAAAEREQTLTPEGREAARRYLGKMAATRRKFTV